MSLAVKRTNTLAYNWSDKHKEYMRNTQTCSMNIAEGAIRSGKTTDNIFYSWYDAWFCIFNNQRSNDS